MLNWFFTYATCNYCSYEYREDFIEMRSVFSGQRSDCEPPGLSLASTRGGFLSQRSVDNTPSEGFQWIKGLHKSQNLLFWVQATTNLNLHREDASHIGTTSQEDSGSWALDVPHCLICQRGRESFLSWESLSTAHLCPILRGINSIPFPFKAQEDLRKKTLWLAHCNQKTLLIGSRS